MFRKRLTSTTGLSISDADLMSDGHISRGSAPLALLPRLFRAWLTLEPSHWSKVAESWLAWIPILPMRGAVWLVAGRLLKAAERYEEARCALARARVLSPDDARIPFIAGRVLRALGDRADAIEALVDAWRMGLQAEAGEELCRYGARDSVPGARGAISRGPRCQAGSGAAPRRLTRHTPGGKVPAACGTRGHAAEGQAHSQCQMRVSQRGARCREGR